MAARFAKVRIELPAATWKTSTRPVGWHAPQFCTIRRAVHLSPSLTWAHGGEGVANPRGSTASMLLHFVGEGHWSEDGVLAKVHEMVCQFDRYPFPQTTSGGMSLRQPLF
jgi:hypothetical protein